MPIHYLFFFELLGVHLGGLKVLGRELLSLGIYRLENPLFGVLIIISILKITLYIPINFILLFRVMVNILVSLFWDALFAPYRFLFIIINTYQFKREKGVFLLQLFCFLFH